MNSKKSRRRFLLLMLIVFSNSWLFPQSFLENETQFADCWGLKVYVGKTQYYGDVSHDDKWEKLRAEAKLSGGIAISKKVNSYFSLRADLFLSRLRSKKGANNKAFPVEYYLAGEYMDFSILPSIDIADLVSLNHVDKKVSAIYYLGIGYAIWNSGYQHANTTPSEKSASSNVDTKTFNSGIVIPMGVTIDYRVSQKFSVFIDGQMRTITNDKLDNWVDGWKFDQLFVGSIGIQYHFNIARYVGPKLVKRTKRNKDYMKVIYGCRF
jgi:hypothetical protein